MSEPALRLTALAHGGGCGCKLSPAVLREILAGTPIGGAFPDLLVGPETSDDAAVWRLNADQALVATTDFFTPVVDDPFDFGQIAAANALSDIYAMAARPIFALAIVGMPIGKLDSATVGKILAGGAAVCARAGIPVAGGHSIDSIEPIYGLVALGLVQPGRILTNRSGKAGDILVLSKPIGVGVLSAALKQGRLEPQRYEDLIATTTQLNAVGVELADFAGVHALTDVTGFGLLGHTLEMCRGAALSADLFVRGLPLLTGVEALVRGGVVTGASERNWTSAMAAVRAPAGLARWRRDLLTDPQTSGGLLIAVEAAQLERLLALLKDRGFARSAVVGRLRQGPPIIEIRDEEGPSA